jgi:hypothetical protein
MEEGLRGFEGESFPFKPPIFKSFELGEFGREGEERVLLVLKKFKLLILFF